MDSVQPSAARRAKRGRGTPRARGGSPYRSRRDARRAALGWRVGFDGGPSGRPHARRQAHRGQRLAEGGCRHHRAQHHSQASVCGQRRPAAAAAAAGPTVCLAISDVVGDDLSVIGSGPTVPDPSTFRDAWDYVERFGVEGLLTPRGDELSARRSRRKIDETLKAGDPRCERSVTRVIGGRFNAMAGAADSGPRAWLRRRDDR